MVEGLGVRDDDDAIEPVEAPQMLGQRWGNGDHDVGVLNRALLDLRHLPLSHFWATRSAWGQNSWLS